MIPMTPQPPHAAVGLPPLVTQSEAAAWINLDRSRLSQIKSSDSTFPAPLPEQLLRAIIGNTRVTNVWARDALIRWAQTATPIRYSDDRPIPLFPLDRSPLRNQQWQRITGGHVTIADGITCGWQVMHHDRSLLVHAYGTSALHRLSFGDEFGPTRLVSTAVTAKIAAAVNATIAVPEFFTMILSVPDSGDGTVAAVTASVHEATGCQSDVSNEWTVGRTLADPAEAAGVLGYELPWFSEAASDAVPAWVPGTPVPVAVFDSDALFVHQANWWLQQQDDGHRLAAPLRALAASAAADVDDRYRSVQAPASWSVPTIVELPELGNNEWTSTVTAAAEAVRASGPRDGVSTFLMSYVDTLADSRIVRIRAEHLPTLFAAAARDADGSNGVRFVDDDPVDGEVVLIATGDQREASAPVVAEMPVDANLHGAAGVAKVRLHADNSLTVAALSFRG